MNSRPSGDAVQTLLRQVQGQMRRVLTWRVLLHGLAAVLATLLLVLALDAVLGLTPTGLLVLDTLLLAVVMLVAGRLLVGWWRQRYDARRLAIMVEERLKLPSSSLINALDLGDDTRGSEALRRQAVARAQQVARSAAAEKAVDREPMRLAKRAAVVAGAVTVLAYLVFPGVFHAVMPRLVLPHADLPPYTLLQFDVGTEPADVLYGRPADVQVIATGPSLPDRATLVFEAGGDDRQRLPMLRLASAGAPAEPADEAAAFRLRLDSPKQTRRFYIDTPQGRSAWYTLDVQPVPLFEQVDLTYRPPAYTGWKPTQEPLQPAGIRALAGTEVDLVVHSNVPLKEASLELLPEDGGSPLQWTGVPDPHDPRVVRATMPLSVDGTLTVQLVGVDGTPGDAPLERAVVAVPDAQPRVTIETPDPRAVVPEGWPVDVAIAVSDDVGLGRLVLQRGVNGWGPVPADLAVQRSAPTHGDAAYKFDLSTLGARAGDVITYFATIYDNRPQQPGSAQTAVHAIQVITLEEYEQISRTRYHIDDLEAEWAQLQARLDRLDQEREALLEKTADLQQQLQADEPLSPDQQAEMAELQASLEEYADEAVALNTDMSRRARQHALYEFEKPYQDMLRRTAMELQGQVSDAAALASALRQMDQPGADQRLAERAAKLAANDRPFNREMQQEREQATEDITKVRLADELVQQAERLAWVVQAQRDLADRLAAYRHREQLSASEQLLAAKLAEEQRQLEQELSDATDRLAAAAQRAAEHLPKMSGSAQALCDAINQGQIQQDMADAQQRAAAGDGRDAHRLAETAAQKLEALLSDCNSMGGQMAGELDGCLSLPKPNLQQMIQQMAEGRGLPGLGSQAGAGGYGTAGSLARTSLLGPAASSGQAEGGAGDSPGGRGRGRTAAADAAFAGDPEQLEPETTTTPVRSTVSIPGVPRAYQEIAEAYFRRLADDSRSAP